MSYTRLYNRIVTTMNCYDSSAYKHIFEKKNESKIEYTEMAGEKNC